MSKTEQLPAEVEGMFSDLSSSLWTLNRSGFSDWSWVLGTFVSFLKVIGGILLAVSIAAAADRVNVSVDGESPNGPVARVRACALVGCGQASAVCVGEGSAKSGSRLSVWITNAHVVGNLGAKVSIEIRGTWWPAAPIRLQGDKDPDLCLLQCEATGVECVQLAPFDPKVDDPVSLVGSPEGLPLARRRGFVSGSGNLQGAARSPVMFASLAAVEGDSGGAILNDRGQLVGINWGGNSAPTGRSCWFHPVSVVRTWLKREWGLPSCRCDSVSSQSPENPRSEVAADAPQPGRDPPGSSAAGESKAAGPAPKPPASEPGPPPAAENIASSSSTTSGRSIGTAPAVPAHKGADLVLWGLSGWSLVMAVAAAAGSGGAAIPLAVPAVIKFVRSTATVVKDIRELRESRSLSPGLSIERVEPALPSNASPAAGSEVRSPAAPFPRVLDEARELLTLRQREGRVGVLDALRGMALDDELAKILDGDDEPRKQFMRDLMTRLDGYVDQVAPRSTKGPG